MTPANENLTLNEYFHELLSRHQLIQPDGRHLYQYRLKDDEFFRLENLLKLRIAEWRFYYNFTQISQRPGFAALFVLYGAEWWRRRYDGSGFSWEPILDGLGVFNDEWNASNRSDCVREGLRCWKLKALDSGFRFLGSVAVEGGLPMKPLAQARGGIGQLLGRILRMANNRIITPEDLESWIKTLQNYLPKSYRQDAIYRLLAETAWTILTLKQQAKLTAGENAVSKLDAFNPKWREQFPLSVEDYQARSLIEQLVQEAASIRFQKSADCLPVERYLELNADDEWCFSSTVTLPETLQANELAKLFETEADELPRFAELSITAGGKTRFAHLRKMAGSNAFRLENAAWGFSDEAACLEHLLRLTGMDGRIWSAAAAKGQPLDEDLPWIFAVEDSRSHFVRQGSGDFVDAELIVAVPNGWEAEGEAEKICTLKDLGRDIYRLTETVFFENADGSRCRIGVKNAKAVSESYEWQGRRWWLDFVKPSIAFRGKPKLYRVDEDGNKLPTNGNLHGGTTFGAATLSYSESGELKHRSRIGILPQSATLNLKPFDGLSGKVIFENWQASDAIVKTPNINFKSHNVGDSLILDLNVDPEYRVPTQFTVDLHWRNNSSPIRLSVPFPVRGTRAFNGDGSEIPNGSMLSLNNLMGVRLSIIGLHQSNPSTIKLQSADGKVSRKRALQTLPGAINLEIRLTDFLIDIDHLLSLDDNPDSKVKITLNIGVEESFTLYIARYSTLIERGEAEILINVKDLVKPDEMSVFAARLQTPNEEPLRLETAGTSETGKLCWVFEPEKREAGAWLIYPDADSGVAFRPTLWTVDGECVPESELACAIGLADQHERNKALNALIISLAEDYAHPVWEEISRLAELFGHLPLTTLDLWRRFSHSVQGMAALAFRVGKLPEGFVSRFAKELPFAWEVIPYAVWKNAIRKSHEHCGTVFGEDLGKTLFAAHCETRINKLTARHGGLFFLLGLASMEFFPEKQQQAQALRFWGEAVREPLFDDKNSHLMNLRRIHAEDEWVSDKEGLLSERKSNPRIGRYLHSENFGYQNHVINAPLLLAAESAIGKSSSWLKDPAKIHLLRSFRAFDTEWFDEAYNLTIVRCLADGLMDE